MSVVVIEPPAPFVDLALAKKHVRVDHDDDDDLIQLAIDTACAALDGPAGWLGRAIGEQTLELRLDGFYLGDWGLGSGLMAWEGGWDWGCWPFRRIALPFPPLVSVVSITYEDAAGVDQVLTSQGWTSSDDGVEPAFGSDWPNGRVAANAVRIRYVAGYPDAAGGATTIPSPIRSAALLAVGDLYANREASVIEAGKASVVENPAVERLLAPFRVWR